MSDLDGFQTDRLSAERLRPEHRPLYLRLFQDPQVMVTVSQDGLPACEDEVAEWLGYSVEHWERYGYGFWIFREQRQGRFVGRAGLKHVELFGQSEIELGYALLPEFWGRGLATEIASAITRLAFGRLGLAQLVAYALATNRASRRVLEKTGFLQEQEFERAGLPHVLYRATNRGDGNPGSAPGSSQRPLP